jgi:hypothetical protein
MAHYIGYNRRGGVNSLGLFFSLTPLLRITIVNLWLIRGGKPFFFFGADWGGKKPVFFLFRKASIRQTKKRQKKLFCFFWSNKRRFMTTDPTAYVRFFYSHGGTPHEFPTHQLDGRVTAYHGDNG